MRTYSPLVFQVGSHQVKIHSQASYGKRIGQADLLFKEKGGGFKWKRCHLEHLGVERPEVEMWSGMQKMDLDSAQSANASLNETASFFVSH